MKNKFFSVLNFAKRNKKISVTIVIILAVIAYAATKNGSDDSAARYVFAKATKQNVEISVTGSGQVSALDEVDVTSEVSGTVQYVDVKDGEKVSKGQTLVSMEDADAWRSVENAELNVTNMEIAYDKAKKAYEKQQVESTSDLKQSLDDGYTAIANAFVDLPGIIDDVDAIFYDPNNSPYFNDTSISKTGNSLVMEYKYDAGRSFDQAKKDYEKVFKKYKAVSTNAGQAEITALISETYDVAQDLSLALTSTYDTIAYLSDRLVGEAPSEVATDEALLSSYISKTTGHMTKLSGALDAIEDAESSVTDAEIDFKEAELDLNEAEDALDDAKETLNDHLIVSPFDGVVSTVSVDAGDKISSGSKIANVITNKKEIVISLNEVDAAKTAIGDKAEITFDAIDELVMTGTVYKIDVSGTVSNNVVSYGVYISFDSEDERIKAGMTANVSIAAESIADALAISSSAIYSDDSGSYVLIPSSDADLENTTDASSLSKTYIKTGLSGDELTEVLSGLSDGDYYVSGTAANGNGSSSGSLFGMFGGPGSNRDSESSSKTSTRETPTPPQ